MSNCAVIITPPNKLNIKYLVYVKPKDIRAVVYPIVRNVASKQEAADKFVPHIQTVLKYSLS